MLLFGLTNHILGNGLERASGMKNMYSSVKWKEFYESDSESMDLVFLGSSYAYRSFDPYVFDNGLDVESFNMGSPLQKPIESYYVLKELLKTQKPTYVVYDLNWGVFNKDKYFNTKVWNFDQLKFSINKLKYLVNVFDSDQYLNAALKTVRYHEYLSEYLKMLLSIEEDSFEREKDEYMKNYKGKGFVINDEIIAKEKIDELYETIYGEPSEYTWDETQLYYFDQIAKTCENEGVELILVTAPMSPTYFKLYTEHWRDYDKISDVSNKLAKKWGLTYFDYNLINDEELIFSDFDFADRSHLNYKGAEKISNNFAEKLKKLLK
jgi:hypothetical protein